MCNPCWPDQLTRTLRRLRLPDRPPRIAILGIGHELRGDDAAGVFIARELQAVFPDSAHILVIEAGSMPENHTGTLRRFAPDLVLLIDAALMDREPGTVGWIDWTQIAGISVSTHTLPLHVFARYLQDEFGCEVGVIGIQPARNALFAGCSDPVLSASRLVVQEITRSLLGVPE
jgi:hydrogenase 3 maturation protease